MPNYERVNSIVGTSSRIATHLDADMLGGRTTIAPIGTPLRSLPRVNNLSEQLCDRLLLRYLLQSDVGTFLHGTSEPQFVTPTPYEPDETIPMLALPPSAGPRTFVLLLKPERLHDVYGPRWVQFGGGIEYILFRGFSENAIAHVAPSLPDTRPARWELEVH